MRAILRFGQPMEISSELPKWLRMGASSACHKNAVKALVTATIQKRAEIFYCEGYAISKAELPFPVPHAWLMEGEGRGG